MNPSDKLQNDKWAAIKRIINRYSGSEIIEEKSCYSSWKISGKPGKGSSRKSPAPHAASAAEPASSPCEAEDKGLRGVQFMDQRKV